MPALHVVRRRKKFYLRLRIPAWLSPHLGRSHVVQTLNTSDAKVATGRAAGAAAFWREEFGRLKAVAGTLSEKELAAVAQHWYERCAKAGLREWLQALAPGELMAVHRDIDEEARRLVEAKAGFLDEDVKGRTDPLTLGAWSILDGSAYPEARREDAAALIPMMQDVVRAEIAAQFQKVFDPAAAAGQAQAIAPKAPMRKGANKPISAHEEAFLAWKKDALSESSRGCHRISFRRFRAVMGDHPFHQYTRFDAEAFLDHLLSAGGGRNGRKNLARATIKKEIGNLRGLFQWAMRKRGYVDENPFRDVVPPPTKKGSKAGTVKRDFSRKELEKIFAAPLFTGAKKGRYSHDPGTLLIADGRFWLPLVALMTGARLGELEQLRTADVRFEEGIDWIFITNDPATEDDPKDRKLTELTLKTENARRSIPILPELKRLGFMDYVEHRRQLGEYQLFDDGDYGKYFNNPKRFLDRLGIKVPQVSFHSFRHSYKQMLRTTIPSDETKNRLMGHSAATVGEAYGPTLTPEEGQQFLDACKPRVDLSHIVSYMERDRPLGTRRRPQRHRSRKRDVATTAHQGRKSDQLQG